jgi:hypothetical protein
MRNFAFHFSGSGTGICVTGIERTVKWGIPDFLLASRFLRRGISFLEKVSYGTGDGFTWAEISVCSVI